MQMRCQRGVACLPANRTSQPRPPRLPGGPAPCAHINTFHHCISLLPQNGNPLVPPENPTGRCIVYKETPGPPVPLRWLRQYDLLCLDKTFDYMVYDYM